MTDETTLSARLEQDMIAALRAGEKVRLGVIRRARAAVKNAEIAMREPLDDAAVERVLKGIVKQHRESIDQFTAGGRPERADQERTELAILEEYLPNALDASTIEPVVRVVVDELGASSPKDMGAVMKEAMIRLGSAADGKEVSAIVRKVIAEGSET